MVQSTQVHHVSFLLLSLAAAVVYGPPNRLSVVTFEATKPNGRNASAIRIGANKKDINAFLFIDLLRGRFAWV